ncbi:transcriptional repressor [Texcoconibacillus texcoconensis]|uniref:Fur family zinc uptake transcriptional regulator n=1 Tax=Texcoconibacillus texcoconensis TaxID=1095777 RepID=A0A840QR22_9BACI|nr:Fur family zinc uptake transcriptional regulator [Texcoconibacillus texcoconensis]
MNVSEAMSLMSKKGYKQTGKREEMLRLFANEKRYISAKDVLEAMEKSYPGLSFDTIYRNLSLFVELDILEMTELDGEKKFRFTCSTESHHHHLICLDCGKTKHIEECPMDRFSDEKADFQIVGHKFEIYGYCQGCQSV